MNFLKKHSSRLIFLVIGILIGFFISRLPIKFEEKISWIALANFFLTVALATYLEFVVRPSFTNNRHEKDFLIEQLNDIRARIVILNKLYIEVREQVPLLQESKSKILIELREISNQIDLLKHTDKYLPRLPRKAIMSDSIFKAYLDYKKMLTGYNFNDTGFSYDRQYWMKANNKFKEATKLLVRTVIDINSA